MIKNIFLGIAIITSSLTMSKEIITKRADITHSFTDTIKSIKENNDSTTIQFDRYAILYKLKKSNINYNELKVKFEKYKKEEKQVKVVVTIPMMEIKEII